jgi:hypothetical protein
MEVVSWEQQLASCHHPGGRQSNDETFIQFEIGLSTESERHSMMSPAICSRVFVKLALILVTSSALPLLCQAPTRTEPDLYPNVWKDREPTDMEKLFHAVLTGDKSVVPRLAAAFDSATNSMEKRTIAGVLMRAGVKDEVYFTFLVSEARKSVDSDTPLPFVYGSDGKLIKGQWNSCVFGMVPKKATRPA